MDTTDVKSSDVLGAVGALSGFASGASAIAKAINKKKSDDKMHAETKRHHVTMEKKNPKRGKVYT